MMISTAIGIRISLSSIVSNGTKDRQNLYWQFGRHRLWHVCLVLLQFKSLLKRVDLPAMAREPDAIKKTELQIPAARGMFAPHLKCLHLYPVSTMAGNHFLWC